MTELFRAGVWHDLICENEESSKFWSIKIVKNTHIRKWGALGTMGQEKVTHFDDADQARADAERMYIAKTRGGYVVRKPQFSVKTELVHWVESVAEFNTFIYKVYGVPFDIWTDQCMDEYGPSYLTHTLRFAPDGALTQDDIEKIEQWVDGEPNYYMTHRLLDDCVRQRLIPAGVYCLELS